MKRRDFIFLALCLGVSPSVRAGAWGTGSFDNDDALDWAAQCARSRDSKLVSAALNTVLKSDYLEAPEASAAVAAAEVVAAALGRASPKLPKELAVWVSSQPNDSFTKLAPIAHKAVTRVLRGPKSELQELWKDSKDFSNWQKSMTELLARLA
jgi:hypothetical protein